MREIVSLEQLRHPQIHTLLFSTLLRAWVTDLCEWLHIRVPSPLASSWAQPGGRMRREAQGGREETHPSQLWPHWVPVSTGVSRGDALPVSTAPHWRPSSRATAPPWLYDTILCPWPFRPREHLSAGASALLVVPLALSTFGTECHFQTPFNQTLWMCHLFPDFDGCKHII